MEPTEQLLQWTETFVRNKDLVQRKLEECRAEENKLICHHKDKDTVIWLIIPFLEKHDELLKELERYEHCALVCYNTKHNFDYLVEHWDAFVNFKRNFHIYFVNPFSQTEKRWTVYPQTHHFLSGGKKIEKSLKSLFSTVEPITEARIKEIIS